MAGMTPSRLHFVDTVGSAWSVPDTPPQPARVGCRAPEEADAPTVACRDRKALDMHPRPLPDDLPPRFAVAQAVASGATRGRLRAGDLRAPHHGLRALGGPPVDLEERCLELVPALREGHLFSHVTALALWGLPLPTRYVRGGAPLHVSAVGRREPRRPGVVGHRLSPHLLPGVAPPPALVPPVLAWVQSAALLTLDELVVVGDALAGRWSNRQEARCVPVAQLRSATEHDPRRPGAARLREAVEWVRAGVESPKETEVRLLLVRAGLPEPELNVPTHGADGAYLGRPDLRWAEHGVTLEYEGSHHRDDPHVYAQDIDRRERFEDHGWSVVRCIAAHLVPPRDVELVARVHRRLARHR